MGIIACIIAGNEEERIGGMVASISGEVDDIYVYCNGTDGTAGLAKSLGARVWRGEWLGFSGSREWVRRKVSDGEWIFQIDCDERLEVAGRGALASTVAYRELRGDSGLSIELISPVVARDGSRGIIKESVFRLYKNLPGVEYNANLVHEQVLPSIEALGLKWGKASEIKLHHTGYDISWAEYLKKIRRNTELCYEMVRNGTADGYIWYHIAQGHIAEGQVELGVEAYLTGLELGIRNRELTIKAVREAHVLANRRQLAKVERIAAGKNIELLNRDKYRRILIHKGLLLEEDLNELVEEVESQGGGPRLSDLAARASRELRSLGEQAARVRQERAEERRREEEAALDRYMRARQEGRARSYQPRTHVVTEITQAESQYFQPDIITAHTSDAITLPLAEDVDYVGWQSSMSRDIHNSVEQNVLSDLPNNPSEDLPATPQDVLGLAEFDDEYIDEDNQPTPF